MNAARFGRSRFAGPALAVAALALIACAPVPENAHWSSIESPKENRVLFLRHTHTVAFGPGSTFLSESERDRLTAFVSREKVGYGDRFAVTFAADPTDPEAERLASGRSDVVTAYLRHLGFKAAIRPENAAPGRGPAPESVTVVLGRYVVVPPACPDWRKPAHDDPGNTPSSNLGCANVTNLGLMVADPADLLVGRHAPLSDGERAARAIERYRLGEEIEIEEELTQE
jgi:pilus assembly protein CpaD